MRDMERAGKPALQLRVLGRPRSRRRGGRKGDQREERGEKAAAHAESIFRAGSDRVKKMGLWRGKDSPGGPCAEAARA